MEKILKAMRLMNTSRKTKHKQSVGGRSKFVNATCDVLGRVFADCHLVIINKELHGLSKFVSIVQIHC